MVDPVGGELANDDVRPWNDRERAAECQQEIFLAPALHPQADVDLGGIPHGTKSFLRGSAPRRRGLADPAAAASVVHPTSGWRTPEASQTSGRWALPATHVKLLVIFADVSCDAEARGQPGPGDPPPMTLVRRAPIARLVLALHLLVFSTVPGNLLLCVGPGGHFEFEAPHPGSRCHGDANDGVPVERCVDVVVSVAPASLPSTAQLAAPIVTTAVTPPFLVAGSVSTTPTVGRSPAPRPISVALRTVILLT